MFDLDSTPGLLFVLGALLPLIGFVLIALLSLVWHLLQPYRESKGVAGAVYLFLYGEQPGYAAAFIATLAAGLALLFGLLGLGAYLDRGQTFDREDAGLAQAHLATERALAVAKPQYHEELRKRLHTQEIRRETGRVAFQKMWHQSAPWLQVVPAAQTDPDRATSFRLGFQIDGLSSLLFVVIALISVLVHVYSLASMEDERQEEIPDETVPQEFGTFKRRGRFSRYFLFLSLLTFALLQLVLADNLLQVFLSWQLVGLCACLLVGFWYERPAVTEAATRVFLLNRAGDVGFVAALAILWTALGTVSFDGMARRVRAPLEDRNGLVTPGGQFVTADPADDPGHAVVAEAGQGSLLVLLPLGKPGTTTVPRPGDVVSSAGTLSPWLLTAAGLCLFFGCMTRAAQGPLYTWLTDALEGPTPVLAFLHAGTMVTAGVYLLARVYPLLTPGVLVVIAYVGLIGMLLGAITALVQDDVRRVLTAVTVSQVGFMLIGLGVGGWSAALFHLATYGIISALLFLGVGCVLHACNRESNMRKLGAMAIKLPLTASSLLLGVLALAGMPFLSAWYSRDALLTQTLGYVLVHPVHLLLFVGLLVVAGVTAFVVFRMWVLVFLGLPHDAKAFLQAEEPPAPMVFSVVFLSLLAVSVAWGWPPWDPDASWLEGRIHTAQPASVQADFGTVPEIGEVWEGGAIKPLAESERLVARNYGGWAMLLALFAAAGGVYLVVRWYAQPIAQEQLLAVLAAALPQPTVPRPMPRPMPRPIQRPRLIWDDDEEEVSLGADPPVTPSTTPLPVKTPAETPAPATPAVPAQPKPREPAFWEVALQQGLYLNRLYQTVFVAPVRWLGQGFAWLDRTLFDGLGAHLAGATVAVARVEGQVDTVLDKTVRETARSVWNLGGFLRRAQTGSLRGYLLCLALAAAGIAVCFYLLATWGEG